MWDTLYKPSSSKAAFLILTTSNKQFTPPAYNLKNKHPLWTVSIVNNKNNSCIWILTTCISIHKMQEATWRFSCKKNVNGCPCHYHWGKFRQEQNSLRVPNSRVAQRVGIKVKAHLISNTFDHFNYSERFCQNRDLGFILL